MRERSIARGAQRLAHTLVPCTHLLHCSERLRSICILLNIHESFPAGSIQISVIVGLLPFLESRRSISPRRYRIAQSSVFADNAVRRIHSEMECRSGSVGGMGGRAEWGGGGHRSNAAAPHNRLFMSRWGRSYEYSLNRDAVGLETAE